MADGVLLATRLTKRFGPVVAVDHVDLEIRSGEVMALLGQNGAGKSTLIQVLSGVHPAGSYEGTLDLGGVPYAPGSAADARAAGIVVIPQQVAAVPDLTVAQNMFLNAEPRTRLGLVDQARLRAEARQVLADFDLSLDADAPMGTLDLADQQLVALARALSARARVLILDEPTAALTESEASRLFTQLRRLRGRGVAIVFVTHRLGEVFALADRIVVLRDGRVRGDHRTSDTDRGRVVREMLGAELVAEREAATASAPAGAVALRVEGLTIHDPDDRHRVRVDGLDLTVRHGEVVGLFGLVGAGCAGAAMALFGAWPGRVEGSVHVDGRPVRVRDPAAAIRHGIGLLAPDRRQTLIAEHSVADNLALARLERFGRAGMLDPHAKRLLARDYIERLGIRTPSEEAPLGTLSGGNQQKVQVARWLAAGTRILLMVDPTHGVDVGARAEIHQLLHGLRADGYALLLASSDAEELATVADRALVMRSGRMTGELAGADLTETRLLEEAAGT
ncbi:sugar ABC transporter ATP-binding protein [Nonomuraea sp. NPDC050663]|uniref:sugar ABC transporter ATP-binding protein n=1 Tax=Nonomuraea sp. NPDC050663 TaxID=3364370 RepID=UPI0037A58D22